MKAVYFASKIDNAEFLREKKQEWSKYLSICSSWIETVTREADTPDAAPSFWERDFAEIKTADAVVCWAHGHDVLRGALVEAGYALGLGKPVICIGKSHCYGTWQFAKQVVRLATWEEALTYCINVHLHW